MVNANLSVKAGKTFEAAVTFNFRVLQLCKLNGVIQCAPGDGRCVESSQQWSVAVRSGLETAVRGQIVKNTKKEIVCLKSQKVNDSPEQAPGHCGEFRNRIDARSELRGIQPKTSTDELDKKIPLGVRGQAAIVVTFNAFLWWYMLPDFRHCFWRWPTFFFVFFLPISLILVPALTASLLRFCFRHLESARPHVSWVLVAVIFSLGTVFRVLINII